jgi:hypothetical protein
MRKKTAHKILFLHTVFKNDGHHHFLFKKNRSQNKETKMSRLLMKTKQDAVSLQQKIECEQLRIYNLPRFVYGGCSVVPISGALPGTGVIQHHFLHASKNQYLILHDAVTMDKTEFKRRETYLIDDLPENISALRNEVHVHASVRVWSASKCITPFRSKILM